jgi:hypothetical protein
MLEISPSDDILMLKRQTEPWINELGQVPENELLKNPVNNPIHSPSKLGCWREQNYSAIYCKK